MARKSDKTIPAPAPAAIPAQARATITAAPATIEKTINRLHPIQVEFSYPLGSRVDMDNQLPADLYEEDPEDLLDLFSSPRQYAERLAPVSVQFNQEQMTGKNASEIQVKFIRKLAKRLETVAQVLDRTNRETFGEKGQVAFMGLGLDPDTISRIIELDYETADNVYSRIAQLWDMGHATPVMTMPFHALMPLYQYDFEIRLVVRIALEYYWPVLKKYNRTVARIHGEKYFMCVVWLPEGAYSAKVLQILHEELTKRCEAEEITPFHLILLLSTDQSKERENDLLMKRWNTLRPAPTTRDIVTIIFKERLFSDWVVEGHPSTKKQLDRTIAKVDAVMRDANVDHLWSHFEPLMTLLSTFKTCMNFEQKLIKLTELGYQPCGPDVFVRRKLLRIHGMGDDEPRRTTLQDMTCWNGYTDAPGSMVRFRGIEETGGFSSKTVPGAERPYSRRTQEGVSKRSRGNPCWKPALHQSLMNVHRAVVGEPKIFTGGMLGLLRHLVPIRRVPVMMRNIEEFLIRYARIHWKEHFIHHIYSEADIRIDEYARECLLANLPEDAGKDGLADEEIAICGAAAEAIYLAHEGLCSTAFAWEHIDQRSTYQTVAMMSLAVVHAIHALKWSGMEEEAVKIFGVFKTELLDFESAYGRHNIAALGVDEKTWKFSIRSQVPDTDLNVIARAARRVGAIHLREIGFRKEFDRRDEHIPTSVGHLWTHEIEHLNFKWENELFCGLTEE
ncbi:hypothetical protein HZA57_03275 [Candidatus Poribacteria bacterium]|nr:hypothetical protein [Candidatus Poribacteria bacterium]